MTTATTDGRLSPEAAAKLTGLTTTRLRQLGDRLGAERIPGDPRGRRTYSDAAVRAFVAARKALRP